MLTALERASWRRDGFFLRRGFASGTVDRSPRGPAYVNDWMPVSRGGRRVAGATEGS